MYLSMKHTALSLSCVAFLLVWSANTKAIATTATQKVTENLSGEQSIGKPNLADLPLVHNRQAASVIIVSASASEVMRDTARRFVETVERSTGVRLSLVTEDEEPAQAKELLRIYLGPSEKMVAAGLRVEELPEEGYRILASDKAIYILGREREELLSEAEGGTRPTLWAVNFLLEQYLGVRWLWPGTTGTFVPKRESFAIPAMDRKYQPHLVQRRLRINVRGDRPIVPGEGSADLNRRLIREALEWVENHQSGRRGDVRFGHSFGDWWEKYGKTHPDYFAVPPEGMTQPAYNRPDRIKLRLANPEVIEQIVQEYKAAGAPKYWNVCPTDGTGFDLSDGSRAWDIPKDQALEDIWSARGRLTARYVMFWNLLYAELAKVNPEVVLATYAYSSFKEPPPAERPLKARAAIGVVCGIFDYELWEGWGKQEGVEAMFLRPNWGHDAANAPYIPLEQTAKFMRFAWAHKMAGFDLDSIVGHWATQGLSYYLWARAMSDGEISKEKVIEEYSSAFGKGAPQIRAYIEYWHQRTLEFAFPSAYGQAQLDEAKSPYMKLVKEGKIEQHPLRGPRYALPYLYTDEVLAPAYQLLDEADAAIGDGDAEARERVAFLRDGLREMAMTRDAMALAQDRRLKTSPALIKAFHKKSDELEAFRISLTPRHVVWGERMIRYEDHYRLPMRPRNMNLPQLNLDGL